MAVAVETEPTFVGGTPEMLFDLTGYGRPPGRDWDVASDGQRFVRDLFDSCPGSAGVHVAYLGAGPYGRAVGY